MQTVYDLVRADAALAVQCRNCAHEGKVSALLLRDRLGLYGRLEDARWRCIICGHGTVTISIGAASLAEPPKRTYRGIL
jgi:hypothetical protein